MNPYCSTGEVPSANLVTKGVGVVVVNDNSIRRERKDSARKEAEKESGSRKIFYCD